MRAHTARDPVNADVTAARPLPYEEDMTDNEPAQADARDAAESLDSIRATEGHLDAIAHVLQRVRALSIQSANGVHSEEDRSAIQIEIGRLTDEIERIAEQADNITTAVDAGSSLAKTDVAITSVTGRRAYYEAARLELEELQPAVPEDGAAVQEGAVFQQPPAHD